MKNEHIMNIKRSTLAFLALCSAGGVFSQSLGQARKWFTEGKFEKAKPVFKKLVRQSPGNTNYNFWYGACCYETGELMHSLPYLEKAAKRKVINGYLYLSKAYYDLYRFDEAVENLEEHIFWLNKKNRDTSHAEQLMVKLRKGCNMIRSVENVTVIDSFVVNKDNLLSAYKLSPQSGHLTMAKDSACTAHTNEMGDKSFYTQRDSNGKSSLYASIKLIDKWSTPALQKGLDEQLSQINYPFMDSDGTTLYFSAQGEECMGGYDLFVTRSDSEENTFLKPDNLGFPFNSPANDYMFAIDDYSNLGWFASDRFQPKDSVCVYVFVPNEQKVTYDYETTDSKQLQALASLRSIILTQTNPELVTEGRHNLKNIGTATKDKSKRHDFKYIVDDNVVYYSLKDFKSNEAKNLCQVKLQVNDDKKLLSKELQDLRISYIKANNNQKANMSPEILDKEKRILQLDEQLKSMNVQIRNYELKTLGKKIK